MVGSAIRTKQGEETAMVETAIMWDNHRSTPVSAIPEYVSAVGATEVVDYFWVLDELSGYFPNHLWTEENSPLAALRDLHSTTDPFVIAALAAAAASSSGSDLGLRFSSDAIRTGPAELMRTMLTLAGAVEGRTVMCLGAGEARQTKPFGYNRKEGLARLEDQFRLMRLLWENDAPFDFKGKVWNIRNGYLGDDRPEKRPHFYALGGGPQLIDIAAEHADGFESVAPLAFTLDSFADQVVTIKQKVEGHGRDPDEFGFGVWLLVGVHDDPEVIDRALRNPLFRFFTGVCGRMNMADWEKEGMEPVMPMDYHYARHLKPFDLLPDEVDAMIKRVPPEMVAKCMYTGTPEDVAGVAQQFVEAGATFVGLVDFVPFILPPEEHPAALPRLLDICGRLKNAEVVA
jgi:phthiodiolone/phenolphthiodiolone dimycocerosates ketoreductase